MQVLEQPIYKTISHPSDKAFFEANRAVSLGWLQQAYFRQDADGVEWLTVTLNYPLEDLPLPLRARFASWQPSKTANGI